MPTTRDTPHLLDDNTIGDRMTNQQTAPAATGLTLYYSPGSCARVTLIALEEAEAEFTLKQVSLANGENRSAEYKAVNGKAKVPSLAVDGRVLTENVAIISFLDQRFPYARLLPTHTDAFDRAEALSLLAWCASGLHPLVTRVRRPDRFCDLPGTAERIQEMGKADLADQLKVAEDRLSKHSWMLGEEWSMADAYLSWVWSRVADQGFDTRPFPHLIEAMARVNERPSVRRALSKEAA